MILNILIAGESALRFWTDFSKRIKPDSYFYKSCERVSQPCMGNFIIKQSIAEQVAAELGLALPLHVMVPVDDSRHNNRYVTYSVIPKYLLPGSFIKLRKDQLPISLRDKEIAIYIATPELCFISAANKLPMHLLAELGCILCANYALCDHNDLGQIFRESILSAEMLSEYIRAANKNKGHRSAEKAIRFIKDGANSPKETKLSVICSLPLAYGGYNYSGNVFNERIELNKKAKNMLGLDSCECDMVWKAERVIVEYDSNLTHLDENQHSYDKGKANALFESGYKLVVVTYNNIKEFDSMESISELIRHALGRKKRTRELKQYLGIRRKVYRDLFHTGSEKMWKTGFAAYVHKYLS